MSSSDLPDFLRPAKGVVPAKVEAETHRRPPLDVATFTSGPLGQVTKARSWVARNWSFWLVLPVVSVLSFGYFYLVAQPEYVSESVISVRQKAQMPTQISGILGALTGGGTGGGDDATLVAHIQSPEMLDKLDRKFNLRADYSSPDRRFFSRMAPDATRETFLASYQDSLDVTMRHDVGIITIDIADSDPARAQQLNENIVRESEKFMNGVSLEMQSESLRFARGELNAAIAAVEHAQPYEREYAEQRLQAATQALAAASSLAGDQEVFVVRISNPSYPTVVTKPAQFLDSLGAIVGFTILYVIGSLLWANVVDHRKL